MLASIIEIPVAQATLLVIIVTKDNLVRMQKADPITLESPIHGGALPPIRYPNLSVMVAYEEDMAEISAIAARCSNSELIEYLERGRVFDPQVDGLKHVHKILPIKEETH